MSTRPEAPFGRHLAAPVGPIPRKSSFHFARGVGWWHLGPQHRLRVSPNARCGTDKSSRFPIHAMKTQKWEPKDRGKATLAACLPSRAVWGGPGQNTVPRSSQVHGLPHHIPTTRGFGIVGMIDARTAAEAAGGERAVPLPYWIEWSLRGISPSGVMGGLQGSC